MDSSGKSKLKIAFLFTGQGSQYPGMGLDLYRAEPVFRENISRCAGAFEEIRGKDSAPGLLHAMGLEGEENDAEILKETGYTQPALYALETSLAALWKSRGVYGR